jgi:hypothetical protein
MSKKPPTTNTLRPTLDLHITSSQCNREVVYQATGVVRFHDEQANGSSSATTRDLEGVSVRIRSLVTGLVEEAFVVRDGAFAHPIELEAEQDNPLEWSVWDADGRECLRFVTTVEHRSTGQFLGTDVQPTQPGANPQGMEPIRGSALDPPWPRFAQLVRQCLDLVAEVSDRTGRDREELFQHVHTQDRYAEQAFAEHNQALYCECWDNLANYAGYLTRLLHESLPRPVALPFRPPEEEARTEIERFRRLLSSVWKQVRSAGRGDLEPRLAELARSATGFSTRLKTEPVDLVRDARRLCGEIEEIRERIERRRPETDAGDHGLLEGST